jgi:hypothetical protein
VHLREGAKAKVGLHVVNEDEEGDEEHRAPVAHLLVGGPGMMSRRRDQGCKSPTCSSGCRKRAVTSEPTTTTRVVTCSDAASVSVR